MERSTQRKAFEEAKTGVKGLADSGIKEIPAMFRVPPSVLSSLKAPPPSKKFTIPTIDLKGVSLLDKNQDLTTRQSLVDNIGEAAEKWGFFQVINHGIPQDMLDRMIEGVRGFHEQDQEAKRQFYSRDHTRKVLYYTNIDLLSSVSASWRDTLACHMAPDPPRPEDLPEIFREIMVEYSKQVKKLGELLFELLSEALGLSPDHLKGLDCTKAQTILGQYYPPCPQPDLTLGIGNHTDFSFITILLQSNIGGLQFLHDQDYIDIPPVPGAFVVNIGDLLQITTNDRFISAEHRVIAHENSEARVAVACFFSMLRNTSSRVYKPMKELLSEHNPPKYRDCNLTEFYKIFNPKELTANKLQPFRI